MNFLITGTYRLRHLSYRLSLLISIFSLLLCVTLFAVGYRFSQEGSFLILPVALAAWFFKRYETWLFLIVTIGAVACINTFANHSVLWPHSLLLAFLASSLVLLFTTIFVRVLRSALDESEAAREIARQAQAQLEQAYRHQTELNQLKDQFIVNVNHELRTPLTEMFGYLELLHDPHVQQNESMHNTFLSNAAHGCEELRSLVDGILDALHTDSSVPTPHCEPVSLHQVFRTVLEQFDPRTLASRSIQLDIPEQLLVWADHGFMRQIVRNLVSNALKYSSPQAPLYFAAWEQSEENTRVPQVCITVRDQGMGIPPAQIPLLFEKFARLPRDIAGKQRGNGLGLYVCKSLIENMGGRIWVESSGKENEGSTFFFTLPCVSPVAPQPQPLAQVSPLEMPQMKL